MLWSKLRLKFSEKLQKMFHKFHRIFVFYQMTCGNVRELIRCFFLALQSRTMHLATGSQQPASSVVYSETKVAMLCDYTWGLYMDLIAENRWFFSTIWQRSRKPAVVITWATRYCTGTGHTAPSPTPLIVSLSNSLYLFSENFSFYLLNRSCKSWVDF